MSPIKSSRKIVRVAEERRARNRSVRSEIKTRTIRAEKLIFKDELELARQAVAELIRALDKAAEKRIIHPNNAARRKSRLMKRFNQLALRVADKAETLE